MPGNKILLLLRGELDHAALPAGMERRENPVIHPEIGVTHMRAFNRALKSQRHAPEIG